MFFIQQQLSEKPCGHGTEVLAYFYLTEWSRSHQTFFSTSPNQFK
jgi:hypothetical protein